VIYASGTGTLASGSALTFDGTNSRLAINTTVHYFRLTVKGSAGTGGNGYGIVGPDVSNGCYFGAITADANDDFEIWNERNGYLRFGTNNAEQMRLTSTGLGIGTSSPTSRLTVGNAGSTWNTFFNTSQATAVITTGDSVANNIFVRVIGGVYGQASTSSLDLIHAGKDNNVGDGWRVLAGCGTSAVTNNSYYAISSVASNGTALSATERLRLDSSGNLGLGVTPSAWDTVFKAIDVGQASNGISGNSGTTQLTQAAYYSSGWKYGVSSTAAARYELNVGVHSWHTAPSGTADDPITFTQAMTLDASGRLIVGATATSTYFDGKLNIAGSSFFKAATNNQFVWATDTTGDNAFMFFGTEGTWTERGLITYKRGANALNIESFNALTLSTAGTTRLRVDSDGLKFNGDTAAANALDDYEQGTFTPTLTAATSGSYTLSVAEGRYTKIGDIVNVQINITVTAVSSPLGLALVGGLPFSYATGNKFAGSIYVETGFNASIGTAVQVADSGGGGTSFYIFGYSAGARVTDAAPYIESTGKFQISLTYKV
jgi:hypothetical protein